MLSRQSLFTFLGTYQPFTMLSPRVVSFRDVLNQATTKKGSSFAFQKVAAFKMKIIGLQIFRTFKEVDTRSVLCIRSLNLCKYLMEFFT